MSLVKVDDCAVNRCMNGGSCVDKVNGFKCICPAGFSGDLCETDINDCLDNPCLNSGSCMDLVNSFKCVCVPGFVGSLCQTNVDDCLTKPCANGGQCSDLINDYKCSCRPGFTGKDCSVEVNECSSQPCMNNATCINRVNEYRCICQPGTSGQRCQYLNNATATPRHAPVQAADNGSLSAVQIVLIAAISTAVPLIAVVSCVVIVCLRRKRTKEQMKADEEARRQNEQNVVHSISKKMDKMDKCLEEHRIVNALDFPKSKCVNDTEYVKDPSSQYMAHRTKPLNIDTTRSSLMITSMDHKLHSPSSVCDKECEPTYVTLDKRLSVESSMSCGMSPR